MINDTTVKSLIGKDKYTELYNTCLKLFNTEVNNQYGEVDYSELTFVTSGDSKEEPIKIESTIYATFTSNRKSKHVTCTFESTYGNYVMTKPKMVYFDDEIDYE